MKQEIIKKSLSNKVPESEWVQLKIMSKMINDNEEVIYEATDNMNHKYKIVYDTETFLLYIRLLSGSQRSNQAEPYQSRIYSKNGRKEMESGLVRCKKACSV